MTKNDLIKKHDENGKSLNKRELGQLRRFILKELLEDIVANNCVGAVEWLDKKRSRLDKAKLSDAIGYSTTPANIRQSFTNDINKYEKILREAGIIVNEAKTNSEIHDDNIIAFNAFLDERIGDPEYYWPKNAKGFLYRKAIWAYFLDINPEQVKFLPKFFNSNRDLAERLSDIDIRITDGRLRSLDYKLESALDEMADTMTNRALATLRCKLKERTEEVTLLREEIADLKQQLALYKKERQSLLSGGINSFKEGNFH